MFGGEFSLEEAAKWDSHFSEMSEGKSYSDQGLYALESSEKAAQVGSGFSGDPNSVLVSPANQQAPHHKKKVKVGKMKNRVKRLTKQKRSHSKRGRPRNKKVVRRGKKRTVVRKKKKVVGKKGRKNKK